MVNLDPDSACPAPEVMKAVVRTHQNTAGIYGTVTRIGPLALGQTIFFRAAAEKSENIKPHSTLNNNFPILDWYSINLLHEGCNQESNSLSCGLNVRNSFV